MAEMVWHSMDFTEALKALETDAYRGLTSAEIAGRLEEYGPNELKSEDAVSPLTLFFSQFKNSLIIILLVAVVLSAVVGELVDADIIGVQNIP
jgi:Ca2+-transporting ATPase